MSTDINRRVLVAGAASTLPAIAMLPAAATSQGAADAELIALGAKLEPIIQQWKAQNAADRERHAVIATEVERATGIRYIDAPPVPEDRPWPAGSYWAIREHVVSTASEEDPDLTRWTRLHARMYPIVDAILARKAQTVAGFAVQVRAFTLSSEEWWNDPLHSSCETDQLAFANAACAFVGVIPVPLEGERGGHNAAHSHAGTRS
jgi:hypothetical protein